jgi:hypothetical protein
MDALLDRRTVVGNLGRLAPAGAFAVALTVIGHRLFVDATAAVYYNADYRVPEAVSGAWLYALAWGVLNGALAYLAYRLGILRTSRGVTRIVALGLLVLDASFVFVLSIRGGGTGDVITSFIFAVVVAGLALLAWRQPVLGGAVLMALATLFGCFALLGSATYDGEAAGLWFDEDTLYIFIFGLIPFASGLLSLVSPAVASLWRDAARALTRRRG